MRSFVLFRTQTTHHRPLETVFLSSDTYRVSFRINIVSRPIILCSFFSATSLPPKKTPKRNSKSQLFICFTQFRDLFSLVSFSFLKEHRIMGIIAHSLSPPLYFSLYSSLFLPSSFFNFSSISLI